MKKDDAVLVHTEDGVALALWRSPAAAPARRTPVLLVHGTFSNRMFMGGSAERGLAGFLAARGHDAWVAELRGHGRSGPQHAGERWRFEDWILRDAPTLIRGVLEHTGAASLVWIGHSAGGIIGLAHAGVTPAAETGLAGMVVAGAPAPTGLSPWPRLLALLGYGVARLVGRLPARRLGIGPEDEHVGVFGQWMAWNLRGEWHGDDGTDYFASLSRVRAPVLAVAGAGDRIVAPPQVCRQLLEACGSPDKTFLLCGRASGFSENYGHNRVLVSRGAREEVWPRIAEWMERRFP